MGRQGREDPYRDGGYASPLNDEEYEEEDVEGGGEEEGEPEKEEDGNFAQECQEYYERRERLKELERQRLRRRLSENGKSNKATTSKPLPYDNYGSFFGPSEPVVARRIIEDARAREEASKVAARQAKEISEQHRISKGSSGVSKIVSQPKAVDKSKQSTNEAALKLQRLKEARDYSFLFTDEDPTVEPPPRKDVQVATKKANQDKHQPKQANPSVKVGSAVPQRPPVSVKAGPPTIAKPAMGAKMTKPNISIPSKGLERHSNLSTPKLSKPPERPPMSKAKVSSQSGSNSNLGKTASGPGRPPQAHTNVSTQGISNGKKPVSSASAAQLKGLVASAPKGSGKQSMPSTAGKMIAGKPVPHNKPVSTGGLAKKPPQLLGSKSKVSTSRPDQKQPAAVTVGRVPSTGFQGQRRPVQSASTSKQAMKPTSRLPKRPRESESDDSFIDDDDGGDVSSMIRKMFGYNPNKYRDLDDDDDRLMEANFHTIQMEEKRSARIAREEDERELALIEEEERREREMARKKRKMQ